MQAASLFPYALAVHVVAAILGLGQVTAIGVVASALAPDADGPRGWAILERLVRGIRISLGVLFASGALLEYAAGGAFHAATWFRLSVLGFVVLGVLSVVLARALRRRDAADPTATLRSTVRGAWALGAVTAVVAVLMTVKP